MPHFASIRKGTTTKDTMATLKVVNLENKETGSCELHDSIATAPLQPHLVKDAVTAYMASLRQGTHAVKTRGQVSGSRKKLFRQKGTGNARQGNAQAPHRRSGGVVFGPTPRDHSIQINKKAKKKALTSVLGEKIRQNQMFVVDELKATTHKTKDLVAQLSGLNLTNALIVFSTADDNFLKASRNLTNIMMKHSGSLNIYDILNHQQLVITKDALEEVEGRLLK